MKDISQHFKKLSLLALVLILIGVIGIVIVGFDEGNGNTITLEEVVDAAAIDRVSIRTRNQSVRLHHAADNEARVIASGLPSDATLTTEVINGVLTIEVYIPRQITFGINFGSIREITEPRGLDVYLPVTAYEQITINSTNGRVDVSDFEVDDFRIITTNGHIALENMIGDVDVQTTNGRITASEISGDAVRIRTTNGHIELSGLTGDVDAQTSNGRITTSRMTGNDIRIRTTNGSLELSDVTGNIDAQTSNGRVTFNNDTVEQNVNLQSTNGHINMNLVNQPEYATFTLSTSRHQRTTIFGNNNEMQQFGDGRYEVTLRTTNGNITVE